MLSDPRLCFYTWIAQQTIKQNITNYYKSIEGIACTECGAHVVQCSLKKDDTLPLCYNHFVKHYYKSSLRQATFGEVQSAEITAAGIATPQDAGESKEEIFRFMDENEGGDIGRPTNVYGLDNNANSQDLHDFLKRPVKILNYQLASSNNVGDTTSLTPWASYLNNTYVKNKLRNFAFLRGDLHLKFVINASPFLYGAVLATYQPLQNLAPHDLNPSFSTGTNWIMEKSQQPHLWIYPQNNEGGDMKCPFFLPKNWINLRSNQEALDMGFLDLIVVGKLASANGVTTNTVNIGVYAWMENVTLSGPTVAGTLQGKDEYKISNTASALAALAGSMTSIPAIAPFATATQAGAEMLAKGLAACGWTNTPDVSDIPGYKPTAFPPLASTEISYPVEKLTMDPKNELSVDPGLIGLDSHDELDLKYLLTKETFLGQGVWDTTRTPDDIIFSSRVTPHLYSIDATSGVYQLHMSPMMWVTSLFRHWRGDIIFRFKFICSPFHKGRVKITFDPMGDATTNIANTAATDNVTYTTLVDLGKDNDVEIRVPYLQAYSFLRSALPTGSGWTTSPYSWFSSGTTGVYNHVEGDDNGCITMRVVTELTAPVASSTVPVFVSVRAAENFEVANPSSEPQFNNKFSLFKPQSADVEYQTEESAVISLGEVSPAPNYRYLRNFGEQITTLRQLLRRSTFIEGRMIPTPFTSDNIQFHGETMARIPRTYGFDPIGLDTATAVLGVGQKPFCFAKTNPISWITNAFIGVRGSINWTLNVDCQGAAIGNIVITRDPSDIANPKYNVYSANTSAQGSGFASACYTYIRDGTAGMVVTNQQTQAGITFQAPMYNRYNFESADTTRGTNYGVGDDANTTQFSYQVCFNTNTSSVAPIVQPATMRVFKYAGIGTDYNVHFFLHTPVVYLYNSGGL